jgi:anthranilate synthase component 2
MQAMGQCFGGSVIRAPLPMHGKLSTIHHQGKTVFRGINGSFQATRYHSLIVDRTTCPDAFEITAETEDGLIMGLSHKTLPVHGVQFHPESILSEHGLVMFKNFLDMANAWNAKTGRNQGRA